MKCNDCRDYLIAYSEGVLEETEKSNVKDHLEGCESCREALEGYKAIKNRLQTLDTTPDLPDPKEYIYAGIDRLEKTRTNRKRWLRPAAVALPVILLLAVVLPITLTGESPSLLVKAAAAAENLKSFQSEKHEYYQWTETDNLTYVFYYGCQYTSPDRYYTRTEIEYDFYSKIKKAEPQITERILVDEQVYTKGGLGSILKLDMAYFNRLKPTEVLTSGYVDTLVDVETLDDESIDGVDCYHIKGVVDPEKLLVFVKPDFRAMFERHKKNGLVATSDFDEWFTITEQQVYGRETTLEFWIGKDDYLMRQWKETYTQLDTNYSQPVGYTPSYYCEASGRLFNLNKDIIIEPPLDEDGELLPGWMVNPLLD